MASVQVLACARHCQAPLIVVTYIRPCACNIAPLNSSPIGHLAVSTHIHRATGWGHEAGDLDLVSNIALGTVVL